jgi:hypothetical protein
VKAHRPPMASSASPGALFIANFCITSLTFAYTFSLGHVLPGVDVGSLDTQKAIDVSASAGKC